MLLGDEAPAPGRSAHRLYTTVRRQRADAIHFRPYIPPENKGEKMTEHQPSPPLHKAVWGVILIGLGALFMLDQFDLFEIDELWRFWPVILIVIGAVQIISPRRDRRSNSGPTLLLIGIVSLVVSLEMFGLSWYSAWPLYIIAGGMAMIWQALFDRPRTAQKENEHVG
jgi:uncharacterized membrane protein HdeD (DUF308 family)